MALTVEIIDFDRPITNSKNLYFSNIKTNELNEAEIMNALYEACSQFGLLYEVQVFRAKMQSFKPSPARQTEPAAFYAFVKFYSYHAARKARMTLNNSLKLGLQCCKVCNAIRFKEMDAGQTLYAGKCQELANYYLGFNGWTSTIRRLEEDKEDTDVQTTAAERLEEPHVRFFCVVELSFPQHGLSTHGIGAWEETYCLQDASSKAMAIHKARKRCHQRALEHAFSHVLLVVVTRNDGEVKVSVEIDTTKIDDLTESLVTRAAQEQVLKVTELAEEPCKESDDNGQEMTSLRPDDVSKMSDDVDDINLHILQELGEANT